MYHINMIMYKLYILTYLHVFEYIFEVFILKDFLIGHSFENFRVSI